MATFERCGRDVEEMAEEILREFESHKPVIEAGVKIDFIFSYPNYDANGMATGVPLKLHGVQALGVCRVRPLKERALGLGDAEITIDGEWWKVASRAEQRALLDHELHHIEVRTKYSAVVRDDLGRPKLSMRKHDFEFGWFAIIAARHGMASAERQQARTMMEKGGQFFWPEFVGEGDGNNGTEVKHEKGEAFTMTIATEGMEPVTFSQGDLEGALERVRRAASAA